MSIKQRKYPDNSLVCNAHEYAHVEELPNTPKARSVVVSLHDCQRAPSLPETRADSRLTGRYEGGGHVVAINQAGWHLQLWWSSLGRNAQHLRADENLNAGGFEIFEPNTQILNVEGEERPTPLAVLWDMGDGNIEVHWTKSGNVYSMRRFEERATLSNRALEALNAIMPRNDATKDLLADEHRPLPPQALGGFEALFIEGGDIYREMRRFVRMKHRSGIPFPSKATWPEVRRITIDVENKIYHYASTTFPSSEQHRVRAVMKAYLKAETVEFTYPNKQERKASWYYWLQFLLSFNNFDYSTHVETPGIVGWLGVESEASFLYEISVSLTGRQQSVGRKKNDKWWIPGAGGYALRGSMTIRQIQGDKVVFDERYWVGFVAVSIGLGTGAEKKVHFSASGTAESPREYGPMDFVGPFMDFSGWLSRFSGAKNQISQRVWLAYGPGIDEGVYIVLDEIDTNLPLRQIGLGRGRILRWETIDNPDPVPEPPPKFVDYRTTVGRADSIHFLLSSATVRDEAREILRIFAASELALFTDKHAELVVVGLADRLGRKWFNDELSKARAENVVQALVDCLGDDFQVHVNISSHGERLLSALGFPDDAETPEMRRVFLALGGVVGVTLEVSDAKSRAQ